MNTLPSNDLASKGYWNRVWEKDLGLGRVNLGPLYQQNRLWDAFFTRLFANVPPGSNLLEIGCAPGKWLSHFHDKFKLNVWGIDYSWVGAKVTRDNLERQGIKGSIIEGDYLSYSFPVKFDAIVSFGVIEHYESPTYFVRKCFQDLRERGVCLFTVPNFGSPLYGRLQRAVSAEIWKRHVILGPGDLESLLEQVGFVSVGGSYFGRFGLGVVNISRFQEVQLLYHFSDVLLYHVLEGVMGKRESALLSPYVFAWGRK